MQARTLVSGSRIVLILAVLTVALHLVDVPVLTLALALLRNEVVVPVWWVVLAAAGFASGRLWEARTPSGPRRADRC